MKPKTIFVIALIYGILITIAVLALFGGYIIEDLKEKGIKSIAMIPGSLIKWIDDPSGVIIIYLVGYALIHWKLLWGAIIIMAGSSLFFIINIGNTGIWIPSILLFLVGGFYYLYWKRSRMEKAKMTKEA